MKAVNSSFQFLNAGDDKNDEKYENMGLYEM